MTPRLKDRTPGERLMKQAPAVNHKNWLPEDTPFPELNKLRERHVELLSKLEEAIKDRQKLEEKYEREDKTRIEAIQEGKKEPTTTPKAKRDAALEKGSTRREAARQALASFVIEAVEQIREHASEWVGEIDHKRALAKEQIELAKEAWREYDRLVSGTEGLRSWIERTAEPDKPHRHIGAEHLMRGHSPTTEPWNRDASELVRHEPTEADEQDRIDAERAEMEAV